MTIAYLVNQYPHTSHSFIRREIAAVERRGVKVRRYSIRRPPVALVDPADIAEQAKTRVVLGAGVLGLLIGVLAVGPRRIGRFFSGLRLAARLGRGSDRGLLRHLIYLAEACVLVRWFEQEQVEHVHAHFGTNSAAVAALCRELGGPTYSFTVHGPDEFDRPEQLKLGEKIARASFAVAISQYTRSQLFRWCGHEHWGKIHVVHCGVDDTYLDAGAAPLSAGNRFVSVGRLSEQKGQLLLVEAAGRLALEELDFQIVLVGDGPMRGQIEAAVARLGLEGRVKLLGWRSGAEVRREIESSKAMVLPSFAEGLPVVIMESLALGRPVISTYIAGIPELVEDGVTGWLVPAGSVEALAEAIRQAMAAPLDELQRMGRVGAERVAEKHDVQIEAAKLVRLFEAQSAHATRLERAEQVQTAN